MCISRILSVCLLVVCFAAATGSPVVAEMIELIVNGDCETVTGGKFDGWTYGSVAAVSTSPSVIDGINSARLKHDGAYSDMMSQTLSTEGISDFALEMDFAVLSTTATGNDGRSFFVSANNDIANVRVINDANGARIHVYTSSGYVATSLIANATTDIDSDGLWDNGEIPLVNHLRLVGTDYGTSSASLSVTLTGGVTNGTHLNVGRYSTNYKYKVIRFPGNYTDVDYLVDNVSFYAIPEPSTSVLLAWGFVGLLACSRRRRK